MTEPGHLALLPTGAGALDNPGLTVALALVGGIVSTSIARHLRLPAIVLLLFVGVVLGPDGLAVVRPHNLGGALRILVGFAVAIILFEGGMSLNFRRLRDEGRAIRQLISVGAVITLIGATVAVRLFLKWDWRLCVLFGTLVIVTGPTVIQPLLRRIRVTRTASTVLEAEAVLIDAVGAIIAAVALEVALSPSGAMAARGFLSILLRLAFGALFGLVFGYLMARLLRIRNLVQQGLENVFVLCLVVALFQSANGLLQESGIATVTVAGLVVGNSKTHVTRELQEFKEQLTVMFIGMLFVLLAADVRLDEVTQLGTPALWVVVALMFVVRPVNILVGTWGTGLGWREKLFMAWIGPRGIVAAAIAAFFVTDLEAHGVEGAKPLQALVFLVIGITVVSAGLTGGLMARILRLRRRSDDGWVILGANELALTVATELKNGGEDVVLIEPHAADFAHAQKAGLRAIFGDGMDEGVLVRAGIDTRAGALAMTANDELNGLFLRHVHREAKLKRLYATLRQSDKKKSLLDPIHGALLFGSPGDVETWSGRIRKGQTQMCRFVRREIPVDADDRTLPPEKTGAAAAVASDKDKNKNISWLHSAPQNLLVILTRTHDHQVFPVTGETRFKRGDQLGALVITERLEEATAYLGRNGFAPFVPEATDRPRAAANDGESQNDARASG